MRILRILLLAALSLVSACAFMPAPTIYGDRPFHNWQYLPVHNVLDACIDITRGGGFDVPNTLTLYPGQSTNVPIISVLFPGGRVVLTASVHECVAPGTAAPAYPLGVAVQDFYRTNEGIGGLWPQIWIIDRYNQIYYRR